MDIQLINIGNTIIAELRSETVIVKGVEDALDLIGNCGYQNAYKIILYEKNLSPEFFQLKTGIAGEILQKFSTYDFRLGIVGNFSKFSSKSLNDFIFESNKTGRINFAKTREVVIEMLTS